MGKRRKRTKIDENSSLATNKKSTDPIPLDIVNDILQRLPAKSVAKFVRVSKSWATLIRSIYFLTSWRSMELQTQQQPHRLLFAFNGRNDLRKDLSEKEWTFFSSSSPTSEYDEPSSMEFISRLCIKFGVCSDSPIYVNGLLNFSFDRRQVISNPSTGKCLILPILESSRMVMNRYFGFDPIKAEYKVLCIIDPIHDPMYLHWFHQIYGSNRTPPDIKNHVLTVGSNSLWREIDSWIPHYPYPDSEGICINGIIYYIAYEALDENQKLILVRFDVKSEKFLKQLPISCFFGQRLTLINYKSRLAIAKYKNLWVLKKGGKFKLICQDLYPWKKSLVVDWNIIKILGFTPLGEIVYTCGTYDTYDHFYVVYHDLKKKQYNVVDITPNRDCDSTKFRKMFGFIDHVESVMLL